MSIWPVTKKSMSNGIFFVLFFLMEISFCFIKDPYHETLLQKWPKITENGQFFFRYLEIFFREAAFFKKPKFHILYNIFPF